ncbi:MAG TPA: DUF4012 domain-containing protein [Jatrophihabitantaceae bacterium]|jgi:hypothetical protein|nr:DUF4012 domain-containing protein [Jatrophihabitantaceae bacterium]
MTDEPTPDSAPDESDPFHGPEWLGADRANFASPAVAISDSPPGPSGGGRGKRRMSDGTRRKRRIQRRTGWSLAAFGLLLVAAAAWLVFTGMMARSQLQHVQADLASMRGNINTSQLDQARATASDVARRAHSAHELTTGPVWSLAAAIPGVGDPAKSVRAIAAAADSLASKSVPDVITASEDLDPSKLRLAGNQINLAEIARAAPLLNDTLQRTATTQEALEKLPGKTWLSPVDRARTELLTSLDSFDTSIQNVYRATELLPPMLGSSTPQTYFVGFLNEAESRGSGGLPGAFAIVVADKGKLTFTHFEPDTDLLGVPSGLDFGADYDTLYGGTNSTSDYRDSTISPNFPYAAQIWAGMWERQSGQHVDGAIALDPTALSYLLAVTGPATLVDGSQVTSGNVVQLTESTAYEKFPDTDAGNDERKLYLLDIAQAVDRQILGGGGNATALVKAAAHAAGERRLLVWSAHPTSEALLTQTELAGTVTSNGFPYTGVVVANAAGNKLDYYLNRSLTWQGVGCGATRAVTATIMLTNDAPASGLSAYVTTRLDGYPGPTVPGDNRLLVQYYATVGASLTSATLNGQPVTLTPERELGHPVYVTELEMPRGVSQTLVLHLTEPNLGGPLTVLNPPLVRPMTVSTSTTSCN